MIQLPNGKQFNMSGVRLANDRLYCEAAIVTEDGNIDKHVQFDLARFPEVAVIVFGIRDKIESAAAFTAGLIAEVDLLTPFSPEPPPVEEEPPVVEG